MRHIEDLRNAQREGRNPGHELGTFLLGHSNSTEYLVSQLTAYLAAAQADLATEREFAGRMLASLAKPTDDTFRDRISAGRYDGPEGFNQFRHDVPAHYKKGGDLLDSLLEKYEGYGQRDRLTAAFEDYLEALAGLGEHEHVWGPLERSRLAGTVHRKCQVAGCKAVNAYDDEEAEEGV